MSYRHQFLDLYCCLSNEYLIDYPQPPSSSLYYQEKKRKIYKNSNALQSTSSIRLSKYKPKNLLHPYKISKDHHRYNNTHTYEEKGMINKIMSIESPDDEVKFYMIKDSSINIKHHHLSQMADGDKKTENIFDEFQQQRFTNNQKHIINIMHKDIVRPVPYKPNSNNQLKQSSYIKTHKNSISHLSSSQIYQPILTLNRTSTWRKLQANITPSHYNHIQQFQRERQQPSLKISHPIMLSPLNKFDEIHNSERSKIMSNMTDSYRSSTSLSIDSPTNLSTKSSIDHRIIQSINIDQHILDDDDDDDNSNMTISVTNSLKAIHQPKIYSTENEVKFLNYTASNSLLTSNNNILKDNSSTNVIVQNSSNIPLLEENENIEEFQPVIEVLSPSQVPSIFLNDILSSFFPTISTPVTSTSLLNNNIEKVPYMLFDNPANISELLIIDQSLPSSFIESNFISENSEQKKVHSLVESIEELCLLIRKLLQYELTEQKITPLQITIANQLAILLTYLAMPNNEKINSELIIKDTLEKMTSTNEYDFSSYQSLVSTVETQTDITYIIHLNDKISKTIFDSSNNIQPIHDLVEIVVHKSSSFETNQEKIIDILPSSSQKTISQTELISTSVTFHLPGHRLHHALSDTFIYHIYHQQKYSSSYHKLISFSETTLHSLIHHIHHQYSTKEQKKYLLKRIQQNFQYFIELESSNTCLEGSTEFTPDFLLTTINNSKFNDDQTEQFGIDTEKQDYQTDITSLIINEKYEKIDTLTFNSIEKENYDSLEVDIEQDNEEHSLFTPIDIHQSFNESNIDIDDIPKSSITEINSLYLNNTTSVSYDNDIISPIINPLNNKNYFCQLYKPLLNTYQWQVPIVPRKINSADMIYEKYRAKINFKYLKIRSNSNNGINIIGKRVRIKSNTSSRTSTPTIQSYLNYNNNNYNEHIHSIQSFESSKSIIDTRLSLTSIDSLCSLNNNTLNKNTTDECKILPKNLQLLMNYSESDELSLHSSLPSIHQNYDNHVKTISLSTTNSSDLSEITNKLDSNIALAESLLATLDSINNNNNSSTTKIDLLHMYIRQFLIEFDTRICLDRKRRNIKK